MKKRLFFIAVVISYNVSFGQLSGTKNIPGDYPTLAAAIANLNATGVAAPGVTLNLLAGNPETAPAGGYSITTLTASEDAPILIQGNGNVITASSWHTLGRLTDAIFKVIGTDYVTITGLTMQENPLNSFLTFDNNDMTEYGIAIFYASKTDGAKNITIENNTITLLRTYDKSIGIYSTVLHSATDPIILSSTEITAASGANDNTQIFSNDISNVNHGIWIAGSTNGKFMNTGIDIGGTIVETGNAISDYGVSHPNAIYLQNCLGSNASYNFISRPGLNAEGEIYGVQNFTNGTLPIYGGPFTTTITHNVISLMGGGLLGIVNHTGNAVVNCDVSYNEFINFTGGCCIKLYQTGNINTISYNTFSNLTASGNDFCFISYDNTSPTYNSSINVIHNSIINGFTKTGPYSTVYCIKGSSAGAGNVTIANNDFSNIVLYDNGDLVGFYEGDGGEHTSKSIHDNLLSNVTGGTITGLQNNGNAEIYNNSFINITGSESITLLASGGNRTYWQNVYSNTISGISGSGGFPITALSCKASGTQNVHSNSISSISGAGSSGSITAIDCGSWYTTLQNVHSNMISGISYAGAPSSYAEVYGIYSKASGTNAISNIYRNNINNLEGISAGSNVYGIYVSKESTSNLITSNLYNNFISDLRTPAANSSLPLVGIYCLTSSGSSVNAFNNTVYLAANSSAGLFGSAAFHFLGYGSVTDLRNNIIVNVSIPKGAGVTAALRFTSSNFLAGYSTSSNFNCYYAGATEDVNHAVFYNGITSYTMSGFKNLVGPMRDAGSFRELPPFEDVSATPYDLHLQTSIPILCESGGAAIATPLALTDDFDGDPRASNPDIGADEFSGIPSSVINPGACTATGHSSQQVDIDFSTNPAGDDVVIAWKLSGSFTPPSGPPPAAGSAFAGGTLLHNGVTSPATHTGLSLSTTYYYILYSYDGTSYSPGVIVSAKPSIAPPASFTATSSVPGQIDLAWVKNAADHDVLVAVNSTNAFGQPANGTAYAEGNPLPTTGTVIYAGPASGFSHADLPEGTLFYYKAWSMDEYICYSDNGPVAKAMAPCMPVSLLPWTEGFESTIVPSLPSCWYSENGEWITFHNTYTGSHYLQAPSYAEMEYIWTPSFTLEAGVSYDFSFWWRSDGSGHTGEVFCNSAPDPSGAMKLGSYFVTSNENGGNTREFYEFVPPETGTYYFSIRITSGAGNLELDDFLVNISEFCPAPSDLTAVFTVYGTTLIDWTENRLATMWEIEWGPVGFTPTGTTAITSLGTHYELVGLELFTHYDIYVRSDCGDMKSPWAGPYHFVSGGYCDMIPQMSSDDEITSVTVNGATNISDCETVAPGGASELNKYSNFTMLGPLTTVYPGQEVAFTVGVDECDGEPFYNSVVCIWIDFNQDGDFDDTGEKVFTETSASLNPREITENFTIAVDAIPGITGMRIAVIGTDDYYDFPACHSRNEWWFLWGEVEDYMVSIVVPSTPMIITSPSIVDFGFIPVGNASDEQSVSLTGYNLAGAPGNMTVTAPDGFEVSLTSGTGFGTTLSVPYSDPAMTSAIIYIRFAPSSAQTYYTGAITCEGEGADVVQVNVTGNSDHFARYCTSMAFWPDLIEIFSITVNGSTNASDCETPAPGPGSVLKKYSNFFPLGSITSMTRGQNVTFQITEDICDGGNHPANKCGIWIDFNQDGIFEDESEKVYAESVIFWGPREITSSFTIPVDAIPGETAMRITVAESWLLAVDELKSCGDYSSGETEDYKITIAVPAAPAIIAAPSALEFGFTAEGKASDEQSYLITGYNLSNAPGTIAVAAPDGFEISLTSGSGFGSSVSVPYTSPFLSGVPVFVRFAPTAPDMAYTGAITHEGGGCTAIVDVSATSELFSGYCTSMAFYPDDESILSVVVNGATNAYDCETVAPGPGSVLNQYSNFFPLGSLTTLTIGQEVSFSVFVSECDEVEGWWNKCAIWIDYNQDGDFFDDGEKVFAETVLAQDPREVTGSFTIPLLANPGETAMRISIVDDYGFPDFVIQPCDIYGWGETEDYRITIAPPDEPSLFAEPAVLEFEFIAYGVVSDEQSYHLVGYNLSGSAGNVLVTAPGGYEVSLASGSGFGTSLTVPYSESTLAETIIYVRYAPTVYSTELSGTIINEGGGGITASVNVIGNLDLFEKYCTMMPTSPAREDIFSVTVNGATNAYDCYTVAPGAGSILNRYSNFFPLGSLTTLVMGQEVSFTVVENECDGQPYYKNVCAIFIDYNRDGDFDDDDEKVFAETSPILGPREITGSFTVPISDQPGETAMRIVIAECYSSCTVTPCLNGWGFGETEDYKVTIDIPETPVHLVTPSALAFDYVPAAGIASEEQFFDLIGYNLTGVPGNITVTAPPNFEVSLSPATGFSNTISLSYTGSMLASKIYARFLPVANGTFSENITITGGGMTSSVAVSGIVSPYCPAGVLFCYDHISRIQLGTIDNSSSFTPGGYEDFSEIPAVLHKGITYPLTVSIENFNYLITGPTKVRAWIDWNNDGDFSDDQETVLTFSAGYRPVTGMITPPPDALETTVRMRIRAHHDNQELDPCGIKDFGEVEDYSITVSPPVTDDAAANSIVFAINPLVLGNTYTPRANMSNLGTNPATFMVDLSSASDGYSENQAVTALTPGATEQVGFAPWTPPGAGLYTFQACASLYGDMYATNDCISQDVTVVEAGSGTWNAGPNNAPGYKSTGVGYTDNSVSPPVGYFYVFGGLNSANTASNKFNINTNTWTAIAPLPSKRTQSACAQSGDYIYIIGGFDGSIIVNTVYRYEIATNTWSTVAPLPVALSHCKAVSYGTNYIYVAGGWLYNSGRTSPYVYLYDIASDTWSTATSMPAPRYSGAFSRTGNTLVYVGGAYFETRTEYSTVYVGTISEANPSMVSWTTSTTPYPAGPCYGFNAAPWGPDGVIMAGGQGENDVLDLDNFVKACYVYKPAADTWTQEQSDVTGLDAPLGTVNLYNDCIHDWKMVFVYGGTRIFSEDFPGGMLFPVITGPSSVYVNSTGNVYNTQPGMNNYIWTVSPGATITNGGGITDNSVTVTWNTTGRQTVSVNYTDAEGCTPDDPTIYPVMVESANPCAISVDAGEDVTTYFGSPSGQEVTRTAFVSGGMPPYTFNWTMDRPLFCNQVNADGDEEFYGGTCINNVCPTSGSPTEIASCSGSETITVALMDTANVCVTVTDANGCTATDCFTINASDVRCFAGNSGNQKVLICHHINNPNNPWVEICVDANVVAAHLSHGDYLGSCHATQMSGLDETGFNLGMRLFPNPAKSLVTIEFNGIDEKPYIIELIELTGRKLASHLGKANTGKNTRNMNVENMEPGIYLVKLILDGNQEVKKLVIE